MGGDESSWLPLWKSPPHPPLQRGQEADTTSLHKRMLVPFNAQGEVGGGHPEVRVRTNLGCSWSPSPVPPIGPVTSRSVTCTELTLHPRANEPSLGRGALTEAGLAEEGCCAGRVPGFYRLLKGHPSQQVSFFSLSPSAQAELCEGRSRAALPDTPSPRSPSAGVGVHPGEERAAPARREVPGVSSNSTM